MREVKPSILIGCSAGESKGGNRLLFSEEVCKEMAALNRRPVIFALSTPEPDVLPQNVYRWTEGRAIYSGREQWSPVRVARLREGLLKPRACQSAYVFPGVVLGCLAAGAVRVHPEMFLAAAETIAEHVTEEDLESGAVYPCMSRAKEFSAHVAKAVAEVAYVKGTATNLPKPVNMLDFIRGVMYDTRYRPYR